MLLETVSAENMHIRPTPPDDPQELLMRARHERVLLRISESSITQLPGLLREKVQKCMDRLK
jgi:hypothetical protein